MKRFNLFLNGDFRAGVVLLINFALTAISHSYSGQISTVGYAGFHRA